LWARQSWNAAILPRIVCVRIFRVREAMVIMVWQGPPFLSKSYQQKPHLPKNRLFVPGRER
jgi:hypothetical protein